MNGILMGIKDLFHKHSNHPKLCMAVLIAVYLIILDSIFRPQPVNMQTTDLLLVNS